MTTPDRWEDVKRVLDDGPDVSRRLRQRARALDAFEARHGSRRRLVLSLAAVTAVAAVGAIVVFRPQPAVREADGTAVAAGAVLVASAPRELRFSEGSQLVLAPQTTARLAAVDSSQVEVVIETGRIDAQVTKGTGRTWRYHAGAWTVRVVGTRLSVAWKPSDEAVDVEVTEGVVEVTGPGLEAPVLVRAGQSLHRRRPPPEPTGQVTPPPEAPPIEIADEQPVITQVAPTVAPPVAPPKHAPAVAPVAPPPSPPLGLNGWKDLLSQGKRREALDGAATAGVFQHIEQLSDADALALADAARLEQRADLSRQLLTQVMARSDPDGEAAFLLGRLESDARRPGAAVTFYRRAIERAPEGPFSEQSRGRLMEGLLELGQTDDARAVAKDYLKHHPAGAWAGLASKLEAGGTGR